MSVCVCMFGSHAQVVDTSVADFKCFSCCSPLIPPACLHPAAHLTRLSATQDQRASPLRGGCQAKPQHAHQQHLAGLTLACVQSCFEPPEYFSVRQADCKLFSLLGCFFFHYWQHKLKSLNLVGYLFRFPRQPASRWTTCSTFS